MAAIELFLKSDQALYILGLPGFVLLLAFGFYQALLKNRVVTPIGQNQSFVILILIIFYFAVVSILIIWFYRPPAQSVVPTVPSAPAAQRSEKELVWEKVDKFFEQASLSTPVASFDANLGAPTTDGEIANNRSYRQYAFNDDFLVGLIYSGSAVHSIVAYDRTGKLRIPYIRMGLVDDAGKERSFERLSDFDLQAVVAQCNAPITSPYAGKNGWYFVQPCYFGRPGGYQQFGFLFNVAEGEGLSERCSPIDLAGKELTSDILQRCRAERVKPLGYAVASEEKDVEEAMDLLVLALNGELP